MSTLTIDQASQYAQKAGFSGTGLDTILAIAMAESGLRTDATNTAGNTPPSTDRGILQFNSYWHPEVTDSCAFDPACAFQHAFNVSSGGTNFSPWSTFTNGNYRYFLSNLTSPSSTLSDTSSSTDFNPITSILSSDTVHRVGLLTLGAIIILVGVIVLMGKSDSKEKESASGQ